MKKVDVGQVISILANVGVIVGIAFLAYEMRQNTIAVRSEAAQGIQEQITSVYELLMDDPMTDIFLKGMAEPSSLSPREAAKFSSFLTLTFQAFQNMYVQMNEGAYDPELLDGWWQLLRNNFESPGFKTHWDTRRYILSGDFQEFVEDYVLTKDPIPAFTPLDSGTQ